MTNNTPEKYNNRDKNSEFYELRQRDSDDLDKLRDQVVDFCKKHNLPVVLMVQACNTPERFGVTGFNYAGGARTANAFYALSLFTKWMQSHTPEDHKKFQKVMALIQILNNDESFNPVAFALAMMAIDAKDAAEGN